jgi:hypothetical protein
VPASRRRRAVIALAALAVLAVLAAVATLATTTLVRARAQSLGFRALLREGFTARPDCPIPDPFVEPAVAVVDCYDGRLGNGRAVTLIVGTERGSRAEVASYLGFYLPPAADLGDAWLSTWKRRVADRGDWWARRTGLPDSTRRHWFFGPAETVPVRADRTGDGGVILAWRLVTLPSRDKVERRMREIAASL